MPVLDVGEGESVFDRAAEVAHRHLRLDSVFIAELSADRQIYRAAAGDSASFGIQVGGSHPRADTFGHRLVAGEIPGLIPDIPADGRVALLPGARSARVGAYIGVPLRYSDGSVYGTMCALGRHADQSLDDRDVRFLELLADLLRGHLDDERANGTLRHRLHALIDEQQLDIAVQPIIGVRDGSCLGVEALSRFPEDLGNPAQVFADADRVGMGIDLERLAVIRAWPLLDLLGPEQFLTVNLSPAATAMLSRNAHDHDADLPLSRLVVEITEHSVISGYQDLREVLRPLRAAGLRVAVDDAGAGYASLRHVVELRPDFIKIDRDLVHGLADDHARRVAVSAFVLLALDLNSTVIAEGLERPSDLAALADLGVDAAQGFLLGRPTVDWQAMATFGCIPPTPATSTSIRRQGT